MIKDIFEDKKRHESDNLENSKIINVLNPTTGSFEEI